MKTKMNLKNFLKAARNTQAFTLTELLIVIAILGMLATFVGGTVINKFNRAKVDSTKIQIKNLGVVLDDFRRECGFYPTGDQGLDALIHKPSTGRECKNYDPEGYMKNKSIPKDAWTNDFIYESDGNKYVIRSMGSDGKEGGEDLDKDISSEDP
ncbi:MAG: type II secretion system protein GspG [Proteobacteria bacterium]|nr:MAG: type II secretion system protein GspG [Pseudomonadota bacterium]